MARAHNFSAGPAALPTTVVAELGDALLEFGGMGAGIMEISHRSAAFDAVINGAIDRLRRLLGVPDDYAVLLLQGGASQQFTQVPLNLLAPGQAADYLDTGTWGSKAVKEAARQGDGRNVWSGKEEAYRRVPGSDDFAVRDEAVYLHYTSNNTIYGTQYAAPPDSAGKPLVADLSSDIASGPIDVGAHAVIYAGAQKNLGPSGVTAVILSPWALARSREVAGLRPGGLPSVLDYGLYADKASMFNTPNTWGIYVLERVLAWVEEQGGVTAMATRNADKAQALYTELDRTDFWRPHAVADSRSQMNVTWRLPSTELEARFVAEADAAGLRALKGHRSVGGIRASLYNAVSIESVEALVAFMQDFESRAG